MNPITAISPLDGRYNSKVEELGNYFSEYALLKYRLHVEMEWLIALSEEAAIDNLAEFSSDQKAALRKIVVDFTPEEAGKVKDFEKVTNHDVKAVEYYINDQLDAMGLGAVKPMVHFSCTSEDINNLSHALMLKNGIEKAMLPVMDEVIGLLSAKADEYRNAAMMCRTHGQPASPSTMGKEFYNVAQRMLRQRGKVDEIECLGKINGAVGNFNAHKVSFPEVDWRGFAEKFVTSLGLTYNPYTTQIEPHDYMAEIFHLFLRFNTILLDFDRDIWAYISNDAFSQIPVAGEVGSSTMPHKVNPIDFENSEGNLGLANALFEHLAAKLPVSRWQRDLTDSTVLRNMGVAFGYSLLAYRSTLKGMGKLKLNADVIMEELANAWPVLGEAMQTVMRRYGIENSYEKLKDLTRGKTITGEGLSAFVDTLEIPADVKEELKKLTPQAYLGFAQDF